MSGEARTQRRDREERRSDMGWAKRLIEYALVILVAIIVAILIIWWLMPKDDCSNCGPRESVPQLRVECDRQFGAGGVRAEQLNANEEGEYLLAYREPLTSADDSSSSDGFSSATPNAATQSSRPPGFVIVRIQPQFPYDYSGGQNTSSFGTSDTNVRPETTWDEVTVTVARYINPLRNERACSEDKMRLRYRFSSPGEAGRFESYCDVPMRFSPEDGGQATYRLFVSNRSSVPIEYCIVSNCDASAPWGSGTTCRIEQQQVQALQ